MNYKIMAKIQAWILLILAGLMVPSMVISICLKETKNVFGFLLTIVITAALSLILGLISKDARAKFYAREGLVCVGLAWIVMCLLGALPFFFSGTIPHYVDAFFETVSGFTTTGSSILSEVEHLGKGMLFWRSFTHWIGGMGVLVFGKHRSFCRKIHTAHERNRFCTVYYLYWLNCFRFHFPLNRQNECV